MRSTKKIILVFTACAGLYFAILLAQSTAVAQGENLLTNPGFEGQYSSYVPETAQELADCSLGVCTTAQLAPGWKPWWVKERPTDVNPEYKPAERNASGNRVRNGDRAAQYFSFWSTHKAGLRQTATVPAGATVQFSIWGQAWMTESDTSLVSDYSGTPNMRIGIDPTGGTNVYSPSIVWSGFLQPFDQYQQFTVTAQAQGDQVTVFTYSAPSVNPNSPEYGFKHTDVYWEDAALTVVGAGSAAIPPPPPPTTNASGDSGGNDPAPAPAASYIPGPTPTPDAEGIIYVEVQAGDSVWAIAARAGISLSDFLELNELSQDVVIRPGELFIIGFGDPPGKELEEAEETENELVADEEAQSTSQGDPAGEESSSLPEIDPDLADPADSAESASVVTLSSKEITGATICLMAYDDPNQNGVRDGGESLRPAVAFTISDGQSVVSNYVTDGESEPFCIKGLPEGSYRVTRSGRPEEIMTTPGDRAVSVADNSSMSLEFGSYLGEESLAFVDASDQVESSSDEPSQLGVEETIGESTDGMSRLIVVAVVVALLLLVAVIIIILTTRRSTAVES
jgi:LysM repeat protein